LGGKEGKFANLFKTNAKGEKEFIGTEEDAKEIRSAYINESEAALAAAK
jgi:hypothetical protein